MFGDLDLNHTCLLFSDSELQKPNLDSLLHNVPEDIRARVNLAVEESHAKNYRRVRAMNSKLWSLYTIAVSLVNNGTEAIRSYGRVAYALDV